MPNVNEPDSGDPDFSTTAVPLSARMAKFSLHMAYWAPVSALFPVVFGGVLAGLYGATNTMVGTFVAMVFVGYLAGRLSRVAVRTGMSTDLFSRAVFGRSGGLLATLLLFGTTMFFAVVESAIIADGFLGYFPGLEHWQAYVIVVLLSVPIAFGGMSMMLDKLNGYLLPFFIVGMAIILGTAIIQNGYSNDWLTYGPDGDTLTADALKVAVLWTLLGVQLMATLDYARFGKTEDEAYHAHITFGFPLYFVTFSVNGAIGIFFAASIASSEIDFGSETAAVQAILELTGFVGLLFIVISQMRINSLNYQLSTVNFQAFVKHLGATITKIVSAIIIGSAVFAIMLFGILSVLPTAIAYTGIFVGSWGALAIVHIFMVPIESVEDEVSSGGELTAGKFWHSSTMIWLVASAAGVVAMNWIAPLADYGTAVAVVIAVIAYFVHLRIHRDRIAL